MGNGVQDIEPTSWFAVDGSTTIDWDAVFSADGGIILTTNSNFPGVGGGDDRIAVGDVDYVNIDDLIAPGGGPGAGKLVGKILPLIRKGINLVKTLRDSYDHGKKLNEAIFDKKVKVCEFCYENRKKEDGKYTLPHLGSSKRISLREYNDSTKADVEIIDKPAAEPSNDTSNSN